MITCITERASSPKAGRKMFTCFTGLRAFTICAYSSLSEIRKLRRCERSSVSGARKLRPQTPALIIFVWTIMNWNICDDKNLLLFVAFAFKNPATSPVWVALGRARLGWARWACSRLPWGAGAAPRRSRSDGWWPIRSGGSGRSSPYRPAAHPFCCLHPCIRLSKETSS